MKVRIPLKSPHGRRLRVLIYARYSTEDQNPSSITDQIAFCTRFLQSNDILDPDIETLSDAEISGELVSRPGIDEARRGIMSRKWDLIIAEDTSRLFRNSTACCEFIETAVDQRIRVIAINDHIDTAEENWEDRLHDAARHHARANRDTAHRISRTFAGIWEKGGALGLLRPGYKRRPTEPATQREPEKGPFYDSLDPTWAPFVKEAFERVARKEPLWQVGKWLTTVGLPKCPNAKSNEWFDRNVLALIRRTVYRGVEAYQETIVERRLRTGKHIQVWNNPEEVLHRDVPHLRIVDDHLWYAANEAIAERTLRKPSPRGIDRLLLAISRDSRGPLSGLFYCGVCGGKMYREGRAKGGYRCSQAPLGRCWNKATALSSLVHANISQAITTTLTAPTGMFDLLIEQIGHALQDDQPSRHRIDALNTKKSELNTICDRLLNALEAEKEPPEIVVQRLRERQEELARTSAELERLLCQRDNPPALPTRNEIAQRLSEISPQLLAMDGEAGALLRRFVTRITAVPFQQFGSNKVVLRAKFEVQLAALLPDYVREYLSGTPSSPALDVQSTPLLVDLFEPSSGPRHFAQALKLSEANLTLEEIGQTLGVAKRQAHIAVQFGKSMREAQCTDPFVELKEKPLSASRWGPRKHAKSA